MVVARNDDYYDTVALGLIANDYRVVLLIVERKGGHLKSFVQLASSKADGEKESN